MTQRRQLSFSNFDEVVADLDLLLRGCHTIGLWSLAQICNHLRLTLEIVTDSSGNAPPRNRPEDPRVAASRSRFFRECRFPDGVAIPSARLVPRAGLDNIAEAEALRAAMARFETVDGPYVAHPYLGFLNKEEWRGFHCIHAAHHFSFAIPDLAS